MARRRGITPYMFSSFKPHTGRSFFNNPPTFVPPPTPEIERERETVFDFELLERCLVE